MIIITILTTSLVPFRRIYFLSLGVKGCDSTWQPHDGSRFWCQFWRLRDTHLSILHRKLIRFLLWLTAGPREETADREHRGNGPQSGQETDGDPAAVRPVPLVGNDPILHFSGQRKPPRTHKSPPVMVDVNAGQNRRGWVRPNLLPCPHPFPLGHPSGGVRGACLRWSDQIRSPTRRDKVAVRRGSTVRVIRMINTGKRAEWSPIRSVITPVITICLSRVWLRTDIGRHKVHYQLIRGLLSRMWLGDLNSPQFLIDSSNSPITTVRLHASVQLMIWSGGYQPIRFEEIVILIYNLLLFRRLVTTHRASRIFWSTVSSLTKSGGESRLLAALSLLSAAASLWKTKSAGLGPRGLGRSRCVTWVFLIGPKQTQGQSITTAVFDLLICFLSFFIIAKRTAWSQFRDFPILQAFSRWRMDWTKLFLSLLKPSFTCPPSQKWRALSPTIELAPRPRHRGSTTNSSPGSFTSRPLQPGNEVGSRSWTEEGGLLAIELMRVCCANRGESLSTSGRICDSPRNSKRLPAKKSVLICCFIHQNEFEINDRRVCHHLNSTHSNSVFVQKRKWVHIQLMKCPFHLYYNQSLYFTFPLASSPPQAFRSDGRESLRGRLHSLQLRVQTNKKTNKQTNKQIFKQTKQAPSVNMA